MRIDWQPRPRYKWAKTVWKRVEGGTPRDVSLSELETLFSVCHYWVLERTAFEENTPFHITSNNYYSKDRIWLELVENEQRTRKEYNLARMEFLERSGCAHQTMRIVENMEKEVCDSTLYEYKREQSRKVPEF